MTKAKKRRYAISSLMAAGLSMDALSTAEAVSTEPIAPIESDKKSLMDVIGSTDTFTMAAHRSHASHSSHRSSSGSNYRTPAPRTTRRAPVYSPPAQLVPGTTRNSRTTPNTSILPSSPAIASTPRTLKGNTNQFKELLKKLQIGLSAFGYYDGTIDGIMGQKLRTAISKYQADSGYKVTGTVTPQIQQAFGLVVN